ncbi:tellurite resistance protein TerB [Winogradskyella wandonensis]|uniref:Tellurite resistance protein TerB n=1 Tax=Winogradskyella wandonensis TaxID=1442586 RepID=A0A4R1KJ91_9FLAO|nr:TerB family tellurite resistance protein [Winogradskyella wandonensis]TCK64822.1 tellurite resistance protein TerB [Winogradskyella wandonensis]
MTKELSQKLGCLFYAIANADGKLSNEEYDRFISFTKKKWKHLGAEDYKYMKDAFNELKASNANPNDCYSDFVEYLKHNPSLFSEELKRLILKTANKIAYSFAGINKSELIMLAKLSLEFKKY